MSSDNTLMLSATPFRPGVGTTSGAVTLVLVAPSAFQAVTPIPSGYTRINFAWAATNGSDGIAIAFGPNDATLDAALASAPVFTAVAAAYRPFLLNPSDPGFKARGVGGGTLTWWIG